MPEAGTKWNFPLLRKSWDRTVLYEGNPWSPFYPWGIPGAIQPHGFRTATDQVEMFDLKGNATWPEYRLVLGGDCHVS